MSAKYTDVKSKQKEATLLAESGHVTAAIPATPGDQWAASDGNNTCFLANAGFQFRASYMKAGAKTPTMVWFDFNNENDSISSTNCSKDSFNVTIQDWGKKTSRNQSVVLTFSKLEKKTKYALTKVQLKFQLNNLTFVNASALNQTVVLVSDPTIVLMPTKLNQTYTCTVETQVAVSGNESTISNVFLRIHNVTELEAFTTSGNVSDTKSQCFLDQKRPPASQGNWKLKDAKSNVCARVQSTLSITVSYLDIMDKIMFVTIPIEGDKVSVLESKCDVNTTTLTLDVDQTKMINLTLTYKKTKPTYYTFAPVEDYYAVDNVILKYKSDNWNFQNHKNYGKQVTITAGSGLNWFSTRVGMSYRCDLPQQESVGNMTSNNMTLNLNNTQWEAFSINKTGDFSQAHECPAMETTSAPIVTTPHPDPIVPTSYQWAASDGNNTCFLANAGFQFRASYMKAGAKTPTMVWFDFNNETDTISSTNCSKDSFNVTIQNWGKKTSRNQSVVLTFSKQENKTKYALTKVQLKFQLNNLTFVNASALNQTVVLASDPTIVLMPTKLNQTYTCTVETQVAVSGNESASAISNVFMRIHNVTELEAFTTSGKVSDTKSQCFLDQKRPPASQGNWKVKDAKSNVCARVQSTLSITVSYLDIMDKIMFVTIPIEGDKVSILESKCDVNTTTLTLDVDQPKLINLTLTYKKTKPTYYTFAPVEDNYAVDNVILKYKSDNWYFQNHKTYGKQVTITSGSGLNWFSTRVGMSYRCDLPQQESVGNMTSNNMTLNLDNTQWEAFSINKTGDFSQARYCAAELTTPSPTTTAPVTPHPHIPAEPTVSKLLVKTSDNKTVCLLAEIGLQIRMNYNTTNSSSLADIGFNMNPNVTRYSGFCGSNTSVVTFYNHYDQQLVNLTFTKKDNSTYLSAVSVEYNITSSYPGVNNKSIAGNPYRFSVSNLTELSTPVKHSYNCTDEADILVDVGNNVIVRITGVKLQAFDVKNTTYSPISACLPDSLPTQANTGNWTITENSTACARYVFAATFNITYPTVLGKQRSIMIPLDNSTNYEGKCNKGQSYFWVKMEEITFTFWFNKTDINGDNFNYHMFAVLVDYNLPSKYFPNHAHDSDSRVQLVNSTLELFSSRNDRSYKCAAATSVKLNDTLVTVTFKNVQVQPFGIEKDGGFSSAENCTSDMSPIIPIIVGSVLAFLVVLVLAAYFIGRKRAARVEYETI